MKNFRIIKNHFINSLIWRGSKLTAENFFVEILFYLKNFSDLNSMEVFYYSILSLRPLVFLRLIKVGSVVYKTPAPIFSHHRRLYAIKFLLQSSRDNRGLITVDKVATLLNSIYLAEKNSASDKKFALYKEAMSNRAFTRFVKA